MNLKEKLQRFRGLDLKTVAYWGLPIYWLILLTGTFLHWNWRWHWVTKFAFHPTRSASTWNTERIPLSLLLAPRIVGLCACTLVIRSWSLWLRAWSLNPCALAGSLCARSLRACNLLLMQLPDPCHLFPIFRWSIHFSVYHNTRLVWTCPSTVCSFRTRCPVQGPGTYACPGW